MRIIKHRGDYCNFIIMHAFPQIFDWRPVERGGMLSIYLQTNYTRYAKVHLDSWFSGAAGDESDDDLVLDALLGPQPRPGSC